MLGGFLARFESPAADRTSSSEGEGEGETHDAPGADTTEQPGLGRALRAAPPAASPATHGATGGDDRKRKRRLFGGGIARACKLHRLGGTYDVTGDTTQRTDRGTYDVTDDTMKRTGRLPPAASPAAVPGNAPAYGWTLLEHLRRQCLPPTLSAPSSHEPGAAAAAAGSDVVPQGAHGEGKACSSSSCVPGLSDEDDPGIEDDADEKGAEKGKEEENARIGDVMGRITNAAKAVDLADRELNKAGIAVRELWSTPREAHENKDAILDAILEGLSSETRLDFKWTPPAGRSVRNKAGLEPDDVKGRKKRKQQAQSKVQYHWNRLFFAAYGVKKFGLKGGKKAGGTGGGKGGGKKNGRQVRSTESAEDRGVVYVLKLRGGNYYVGFTYNRNLPLRMQTHYSGGGCGGDGDGDVDGGEHGDGDEHAFRGAAWTEKHPPLMGEDPEVYDVPAFLDGRVMEDAVTKQLMAQHGPECVRGASYCCLDLNHFTLASLGREIDHIKGKCFTCGNTGHLDRDCPAKRASAAAPSTAGGPPPPATSAAAV